MNFKSGGKAIQQLRKQKNLTQEQLAEQVALSSNTISRIERGLLMPSVATLCDLCNALETSAETFSPHIFMQTVRSVGLLSQKNYKHFLRKNKIRSNAY